MRLYSILIFLGMMVVSLAYLASCHSNLNIKTAQYAVNGQKLYVTHCQNCHGANGEGLGKLYPPLTDPFFFERNREQLSCIIRNGMQGEVEINGEIFNEKMPANPQLTELDIAYILTYITTRFTKQDSIYSHEEVKEALKKCT